MKKNTTPRAAVVVVVCWCSWTLDPATREAPKLAAVVLSLLLLLPIHIDDINKALLIVLIRPFYRQKMLYEGLAAVVEQKAQRQAAENEE
jgi:hypothetical protein